MTDQEIVRALRCCAKGLGHDDACENCKVGEIQNRREYIEFAAANVIERLTAENAALREGASLGKVKRSQKQAYEKQIKSLQALADRQSSEIKKLQGDLSWKNLLADCVLDAQERAERAEAERDALLPYAKEYGCDTCANEKACFVTTREGVTVSCVKCPVPDACPCSKCKDRDNWKWRGLPEALEEGEKV